MDGKEQRVRVLLDQPVRCPPTPEDRCISNKKGDVLVKFSHTENPMNAQGWQQIGRLDQPVSGGPGRLRLLSSGDGYVIEAVVVVVE
eukprot:7212074-Prymnesium_polylepis.1